MKFTKLGLLSSAIFCSLTVIPSQASATGFYVARFGGEHGNPMNHSPTSIYYNPAGIGFSQGTHLYIDVNMAWRRVTFSHEQAPNDIPEPEDGQGANNGKAKLFNVLASPMIGVSTKLGDLALGAGFYTPFGGQGSWDENEAFANNPNYAGPIDGVQRWYAIDGKILSSFFTLNAAYQLADDFSVGASFNLIRSSVETIRARIATGDNALPNEGRSLIDVGGFDWSFGVGVMWEPLPDELRIGASYQSRPNVSGGMRLDGTLENNFGGNVAISDVDLEYDLPDIYRLGVQWNPQEDLQLRLFTDYQNWSVLERHCVIAVGGDCEVNDETGEQTSGDVLLNQERDWHDTFSVRGGVSYWINPETELFAGTGYGSQSVPDATLEPALPDWEHISLALGGRFEVAEKVFTAISYTQFYYFSRDNTGQSDHSNLVAPTRSPDSGGKYKQQVGVFNINADFEF